MPLPGSVWCYEVAVISLKVLISLTVPFSILRCVPANSVFAIPCMCNLFLHLSRSETSPEHFNWVFSTVRKTKTLGTEWMLVVDWLIFRHGVFPAVKSNRVENAPCDVTREILLNIIHTHQIKIRQKKLRNLFTPLAIFFVTKFHVFVIMSKATSEVFSSYQRNRTVLSFRERYRRTVLYQTNCGYDGTKRGFTKCDLIATKRTKLFFSLSEQ